MNLTLKILSVVFGLLVIYDIIIEIVKGGSWTISWQGYEISQKYPVIAFGLGFILGHLFWSQSGIGCK